MKLYYYIRGDKINNFGDSLNPWLWNQLIASQLDEDKTTAFVGIGTLINNFLLPRLPNAKKIIIFSSGVGYIEDNSKMPALDRFTKIYCVRGRLSAQKLGLSDDLAIADGALLIKRLYRVKEDKDYQFAFMPHVQHAILDDRFWVEVCSMAGMRYINPSLPTTTILSLIDRTQVLLTEAMHGAIASEALRIPWIPIVTSPRILEFKWLDWCDSVNLDYQPAYIQPLVSCYPFDETQARFNENWLSNLQPLDSKNQREIRKGQQELVAQQLMKITKNYAPNLAKDTQIENLVIRLEEKIDEFKIDVNNDIF